MMNKREWLNTRKEWVPM